jgi:signal transduction histidine kinase
MIKKNLSKLRSKIFIRLLLITLPLCLALGWFLSETLKKNLIIAENQVINRNWDLIDIYFENRFEYYNSKLNDWAKWDDAYEFAKSGDQKFVYKNLRNAENVFKSLNVDFLVIKNDQGKILYKKSFDSQKKISDSRVDNLDVFIQSMSTEKDWSGYTIDAITKKAVLAVSLYISDTDATAKSNGVLIAGKYLDENFVAQLSKSTKLEVEILVDQNLKNNTDFTNKSIASVRQVFSKNEPSGFAIKYTQERSMNKIYVQTIITIATLLVTSFIILGVLIYLFFKYEIINRLSAINEWLTKFQLSKNQQPLVIIGQDEISDLKQSISDMATKIINYHHEIAEKNQLLIESTKLVAIGELAGGIAHEINNPLAIIQGRSQQLLRLIKEDKINNNLAEKYTSHIITTVDRMAKTIKGLKTITRRQDQHILSHVSIKKVVNDTIDLCQGQLKSMGIQLMVCDMEDIYIMGSEVQLSQVLLNIINNSKDAIESLEHKWIKILVHEENESYVIKILDSGMGIDLELQNKIMQPFFTTKDIGKGTGLGLSISKQIIESFHGNLTYDTSSDNTCFTISLPKITTIVCS